MRVGARIVNRRLIKIVSMSVQRGTPEALCSNRVLPFVTLASQVVVEIERSAGYAERIITRSIDRAGRE
jgi:hypothetical protein